jgi:hypothetical protein
MKRFDPGRRHERGQIIVLFALASAAMLMVAGLVIDGGFALAQRRASQNAADLAALAGARVIASFVARDTVNGTDANVRAAIDRTLAANGAPPITYGAPDGPAYFDFGGNFLGYVGTGTIPAGTIAVRVSSSRSWQPFFLGIIGVASWDAGATATARGGFRAGGPPPGNLLPIGVSEATYNNSPICPAGTPTEDCTVVDLTEDSGQTGGREVRGIPGGFGWLKFGCGDWTDLHGNPFGLGQNTDGTGCENNKPFLEGQWGNLGADPPVMPRTYGCCSEVGLPGSGDKIGSLPGNKAAVDNDTPGVAYYINNEVIGFVPIYRDRFEQGQNGYYHIIGYAGFQLVYVKGAREIRGILRQVIFPGPVTPHAPGFAGSPLAVQLLY